MKKINFLAAAPIVLGFLLIAAYFYPAFTGKTLSQNDVIQSMGAIKEAKDFKAATGEEILWSNSMFSGMPVWDGFNANVLLHVHRFLTHYIPVPALISFYAFISFYLLLIAYRCNRWLAFAGGLAFAFSTFNIISIEAGHINKVFAIAFMPAVIAGIVWVYRGKWVIGALVAIIATSLHVFYFHVQITYYLLMIILFLGIVEFITQYRAGKLMDFLKGSAILVVAALIAVLPNMGRMMTMQEYAKATPRGGSELTKKAKDKGGLDYDYAFQWSNGIAEPMTIFIPGFYGGSSTENIGKSSEFFKYMKANYPDQAAEYSKRAPLYWGDQPFTSGPVYFGAIICFFFVLGMFLLKEPWKWAFFAVSILSIILSYGKNLPLINDFFFYKVPMYNKFRSVTMILSIAQLAFPLIGLVALKKIVDGEYTKEEVMKAVKYTLIGLGGIALFFILFAGALDVSSENDVKLGFPEPLLDTILSDRTSRIRFDAMRSLFFVLAGAGLVWAWINDKLKAEVLYVVLALVIVADLWTVDRKYLSKDNFKPGKNIESTAFVPTSADEMIQRDTTTYFRVFNTEGAFSDATTSYYHKSIGGYSAIKLGRYQDVIDSCLYKNNMQVVNMLNTKYFILLDRQSGTLFAQPNPGALGNAWFVSNVQVVKNADEELNGLKTFNPAQSALVDQRFEAQVKGFTPQVDSNASIRLTVYHPNRLTYSSQAATDQIAVFSEIYFAPGWQAYVDGKPTDHFRCDYILRGMKVPAGHHKIEFKFEPEYYAKGEKIAMIGSTVMMFSLVGLIGLAFYTCRKKEDEELN